MVTGIEGRVKESPEGLEGRTHVRSHAEFVVAWVFGESFRAVAMIKDK